MEKRIITAESVTAGHPDKLADIIADSILDECLKIDPASRVACEVMLTKGAVILAGEITTRAFIDYAALAADVIKRAGYELAGVNFYDFIHKQSPEIAAAVDSSIERESNAIANMPCDDLDTQGAGDQGIVYGYAIDESLNLLPLAAEFARALTNRLTVCRENKIIKGLRPDGKAQVSLEYSNDRFRKVKTVILSAQHDPGIDIIELSAALKKHVIHWLFADVGYDGAEILINPSGSFIEGGFNADTGLTGRKLMVDTYGGIGRHGGGAFAGKDASKLDRSGAYMARYIAKNVVAAGLAEKCEVSIAYAIGKAQPVAFEIDTLGTSAVKDDLIKAAALRLFDLRPRAITKQLQLNKPRTEPFYAEAARRGAFGNDFCAFPWEETDKAAELRQLVLRGGLKNDK